MKKQYNVLLTFVALFFFACQPPVTFDRPQPADVKSINSFSGRIQGQYLSNADHSILLITANSLIRIYDYNTKIHVSQLDSSQQLIGDSLFDLNTNIGSPVVIEGDSIVQHIYERDTFFAIDEFNVLKKFKGYYFLNTITKNETWEVEKLEISRGTLKLSSIDKAEDLAQLKAITETSQDTIPYIFAPSKREFKTFVRNEGFRNSESFRKIKK